MVHVGSLLPKNADIAKSVWHVDIVGPSVLSDGPTIGSGDSHKANER